jgi:sugar phosphate isomerase/epimerase
VAIKRFSCQTFTWQMLGTKWDGDIDDVLDGVAASGYVGIEVTPHTIGKYGDDAEAFSAALERRNLRLSAFACSSESGWTDPAYYEADLAMLKAWLSYLERFPATLIALGGAATHDPSLDHEHAFANACHLYNKAGHMAAERGVAAVVHPSSQHGSILETSEDYYRLLDALDPAAINLGPDTGHMLRGGQDVLVELRALLPRIRQLHLKDAYDHGTWAPMGTGDVDIPGVLPLLDGVAFDGWVTLEEEADAARRDPAAAVAAALRYCKAFRSEQP